MMENKDRLFLEALRASLKREKITWDEPLSEAEWTSLFSLASRQMLVPLIFDTIAGSHLEKQLPPALSGAVLRDTLRLTALQAMKTQRLFDLLAFLDKKGLHPLVVKGVVCRVLYPEPDLRWSGDEDLLILPEQAEDAAAAVREFGMAPDDAAADFSKDHEISFTMPGSPFHIELHKTLFPPESEAYGDLNRFFEQVFDHSVFLDLTGREPINHAASGPDTAALDQIPASPAAAALNQNTIAPTASSEQNTGNPAAEVPGPDARDSKAASPVIHGPAVRTLDFTENLLYLICHAFKHFLHSGFGIRQVCDIMMFSEAYGRRVNWEILLKNLQDMRGEYFAAALFRIGELYLDFSPEKAGMPSFWRPYLGNADPEALLNDLMDSGIYGSSSMSRKHSSTITLSAAAAEKSGRPGSSGGHGVLRSLFPPARSLVSRYPYLEHKPWLLPAAWASRILTYKKETAAEKETNNAADTLKIGQERVELLRKYRIIR